MRKRIDVHLLRIGMYVAELDRPWLGTPFLFQGFEIRSQDEIEELRRFCKTVFITVPDENLNPAGAAKSPPPASRPVLSDAEQRIERDVLKIINQPRAEPVYRDVTTLEQEIGEIKAAHAEARALVLTAYDDARLGRILDTNGARRAVQTMVDSVLRNPDALTCFTLLKKKDEYTALHSLRVSILALTFGRHLGLDTEQLQVLGMGALLHDIGKVKVPNDILNKPGRLDEREYAIMRTHVPHGVEILSNTPGIPRTALEVARCHHERYNGSGYIEGLQGEDIGFFGMIGGIVDCYDAITSDRAYHAGIPSHAALKKMYEWRSRDFHPNLVEQFIQCIGIYPIGSVVELNTGEIGVVVTMNRVRRLKPRVTLVLRANCTPLPAPLTIDLMHHKTADGRACEIERVLEAGAYGIDPVMYLPVHPPTTIPPLQTLRNR
ncbi:MAG: HD-GYP domain-containing protein [Gammaproteobacteria bacterium]